MGYTREGAQRTPFRSPSPEEGGRTAVAGSAGLASTDNGEKAPEQRLRGQTAQWAKVRVCGGNRAELRRAAGENQQAREARCSPSRRWLAGGAWRKQHEAAPGREAQRRTAGKGWGAGREPVARMQVVSEAGRSPGDGGGGQRTGPRGTLTHRPPGGRQRRPRRNR